MTSDRPAAESWRRALDGDRDAFEEALAPYTDDLRSAARRQLEVERDVVTDEPVDGASAVDLTPDELVGETLLRAWDLRNRFDGDRMGFRAWLLGLQTRSLARFAQRENRYAQRKAISFDEELPTNEDQDAVGEQFYEFRQPFDVDTYEEVIVGEEPADPEIGSRKRPVDEADLSDEDREALGDASFRAEVRQATVLHDEFDVTLPETAQILDASLKDTAAYLGLAREGLLARLGSTDDDHDDDPAVDSYTGDPLPDA
jgi:DNA-directed RNA polymerase specialized sigma24 family protein